MLSSVAFNIGIKKRGGSSLLNKPDQVAALAFVAAAGADVTAAGVAAVAVVATVSAAAVLHAL